MPKDYCSRCADDRPCKHDRKKWRRNACGVPNCSYQAVGTKRGMAVCNLHTKDKDRPGSSGRSGSSSRSSRWRSRSSKRFSDDRPHEVRFLNWLLSVPEGRDDLVGKLAQAIQVAAVRELDPERHSSRLDAAAEVLDRQSEQVPKVRAAVRAAWAEWKRIAKVDEDGKR